MGFENRGEEELRPKPVCTYLLDRFRLGDIHKVYLVLRTGKWDLPAYLGTGSRWGSDIAYLTTSDSISVPQSLDRAYQHVREATVALGFPDIILHPGQVFARLLRDHRESGADVSLGLFPVDRPAKVDMVALSDGAVQEIVVKPHTTNLKWTWLCAVWEQTFTERLHEVVMNDRPVTQQHDNELFLGDIVQSALVDGFTVRGVSFDDGRYLDIGTPEDLRSAVSRLR